MSNGKSKVQPPTNEIKLAKSTIVQRSRSRSSSSSGAKTHLYRGDSHGGVAIVCTIFGKIASRIDP